MKFKKIFDLTDPENPTRDFSCKGIIFHNGYFYIRSYAHIHCIEPENFNIIWSIKCAANTNSYFPLYAQGNVLVYNAYIAENIVNDKADAGYKAEFGSNLMKKTTTPIVGFCLETQKELWSIDIGWAPNGYNAGFVSDENGLLLISKKDKEYFLNKVDIKTGDLNNLGPISPIKISGNDQGDKLTAVYENGYLYFANALQGLNRIKISDQPLVEENLIACSPERFVKIDGKLYFFSRGELQPSFTSTLQPILYSIDTESGKPGVGLTIGGPIQLGCIALINFNGRLLCITGPDTKGLFCYDAITGELLWKLGEGEWNVRDVINTPIGIIVKVILGFGLIVLNPISGETIQTDFLDPKELPTDKLKYVNDTLFVAHSKGLGVYQLEK